MIDIKAKIVEMFWYDYTSKDGNDVPDHGQTQILRDFFGVARSTHGRGADH
jgi:hypothetical protein